jgi:alpha-L-rhamnosidase
MMISVALAWKSVHGRPPSAQALNASGGIRLVAATCENKTHPTGVGLNDIRFSWQLDSKDRNCMQAAWQLVCASTQAKLDSGVYDCWNSGIVRSNQSLLVPYHGKVLRPGEVYWWRVRVWDDQRVASAWSPDRSFTTGLFHEEDWAHARWIGYEDLPDSMRLAPGVHFPDAGQLGSKCVARSVVPLFRKTFRVDKTVRSALLFVSGLGQYEMTVNGARAGDAFLTPGWTDYDKRCLYDTYDITTLIKKGENAMGAIVGNGFYNINRERYFKLVDAYGYPKLICRLKIRYSDGSVDNIVTDPTWQTSPSPITFSSIYGGEDYDARKEQAGWDRSGFAADGWRQAIPVQSPTGRLVAGEDYPVMLEDSFRTQHVTEPAPRQYVYDFGQNASGIVELKVKGKRGQTIRLTPGEILDKHQMIDQTALTEGMDSLYYLSYTLKGEGVETWRPKFTYYGFRYLQMEGAEPGQVSLTALHNRNSAPSNGSFECSAGLFNRIYTLINWAIKSNLQSVVTDCPHREKLGWLEQDYLMGASIHYNYDIYHLYKAMVRDMMDAQTADGLVPDIAPEFVTFAGGFRDSPEWGSAAVILPWQIYTWYGDKQVLEMAYPMMQRYIRYLQSRSSDNILSYGLGDWYDFGPGPPGDAQLTPKALTATAIYYYDVHLMAKMAELLQKQTDEAFYGDLATKIQRRFNDMFFHRATKVYATGSQTAMAMPLCVGLVVEKDEKDVLNNLVDSINKGGRALTAGDIGFHFLVKALDEGGCSSLIYAMNNRSDVPGYGLQLKKGATALTESWNALEHSSNDHLMLGHIMEWLYGSVAGISQDEQSVAYKHIVIRPQPVGDMTSAKGSFRSPYGVITSYWRRTAAGLTLSVHIPVNTTATVKLPLSAPSDAVYMDDRLIDKTKYTVSGNTAVLEVGSGDYRFGAKPVGAAGTAGAVGAVTLSSPSGHVSASVYVDSAQRLRWSLQLNGRALVEPSALGISVDHADLGQDVSLGKPVFSMTDERYPWKGVHGTAVDHYRQAVIPVRNRTTGTRYRLECRIFDDGFAYRYVVPGKGVAPAAGRDSTRVTGESGSWAIPAGSTVWYQENVYYYEGLYYSSPVADLGERRLGPPVTYETPDGDYASITEAALYNYSGMSLQSDSSGVLHAAFVNDPDGWTIAGNVVSPWRVVLAGKDLNRLVNSDIIPDLNPAPDGVAVHAAWIKPGRAVWSYFMHDNVTTLQLEKTYVDKAALLGFEYSVVDAGWDASWPNSLDSLRSLVDYARKRRVGIFVWKSYASLRNDSVRADFFRAMNRVGVAGVKIDYIDKEGIDQVRFYEHALQDALAFRLMIDFHGANKPTGYNRPFPNEITREGIYGQEWRTYTPEGPVNNAIIPFTRYLAGPGDYTPGVFNSVLAYGTSRAQQLALPIIYNSPLMCWPDDPDVYLGSPALPVIEGMPTVWDETRVLAPSGVGQVAVFARRKGRDWFVGAINAGDEKRFSLPLSFLGGGGYRAEILADDLTNSDRMLHSVTACVAGDSLPVVMKAKGGYVVMLRKVVDPPPALAIFPGGGYLEGPVPVRIGVKGAGSAGSAATRSEATQVIRYTTDGSEPDGRSAEYTGPLTVTDPQLLRARVFDGGKAEASDVVAQFLNVPAPVLSPAGGIFTGKESVRVAAGAVSHMPGDDVAEGDIRYTIDGSDPTGSSPLFGDSLVLDHSTTIKSREFFRVGGRSEMSEVAFRRVEPDPAVADTGSVAGLHYSYYEGKWDSMPDFSRLAAVKEGVAATPDLSGIAGRPDNYSIQFRGYVDIPETGVYTFYTISDDGSQLYIGDAKVVDNDGCHGDLERSGDRALAAGRHPITVNYFQQGSGQTLQVYVKGPHLEKQLVTAGLFSRMDR